METVINFLIESAISLTFFAMVYMLILRKETFFGLNRMFLLGSLLFSVVLPFMKIRIYEPDPVMLSEVTVTPYRNMLEAVTVYSRDFSGSVEQAVLSAKFLVFIYLLGLLVFTARFLVRIIHIFILIRKNPVVRLDGFYLVTLPGNAAPFSFMRYVFAGKEVTDPDDHRKMILHELEHVRQGHSFDVVILELLAIFQWFNPFMWMLRRSVRENHEFLADHAVLRSGVSRGDYKKLLLNQFAGGQLVLANHFNYSLIKKRIAMMSKIKSSKWSNSKIIFGIFTAAALIIAFACEQKEQVESAADQNNTVLIESAGQEGRLIVNGTPEELEKFRQMFSGSRDFEVNTDSTGNLVLAKKKEIPLKSLSDNEEIFFIVDDMPEFPGGELELRKYIANKIEYPEIARKNGIQGKVYVTFVVSKDGSVANARIARGVDPSLDKEALRVVGGLPVWKPGKQKGEPVNVSYTVPINFVLQ